MERGYEYRPVCAVWYRQGKWPEMPDRDRLSLLTPVTKRLVSSVDRAQKKTGRPEHRVVVKKIITKSFDGKVGIGEGIVVRNS